MVGFIGFSTFLPIQKVSGWCLSSAALAPSGYFLRVARQWAGDRRRGEVLGGSAGWLADVELRHSDRSRGQWLHTTRALATGSKKSSGLQVGLNMLYNQLGSFGLGAFQLCCSLYTVGVRTPEKVFLPSLRSCAFVGGLALLHWSCGFCFACEAVAVKTNTREISEPWGSSFSTETIVAAVSSTPWSLGFVTQNFQNQTLKDDNLYMPARYFNESLIYCVAPRRNSLLQICTWHGTWGELKRPKTGGTTPAYHPAGLNQFFIGYRMVQKQRPALPQKNWRSSKAQSGKLAAWAGKLWSFSWYSSQLPLFEALSDLGGFHFLSAAGSPKKVIIQKGVKKRLRLRWIFSLREALWDVFPFSSWGSVVFWHMRYNAYTYIHTSIVMYNVYIDLWYSYSYTIRSIISMCNTCIEQSFVVFRVHIFSIF